MIDASEKWLLFSTRDAERRVFRCPVPVLGHEFSYPISVISGKLSLLDLTGCAGSPDNEKRVVKLTTENGRTGYRQRAVSGARSPTKKTRTTCRPTTCTSPGLEGSFRA